MKYIILSVLTIIWYAINWKFIFDGLHSLKIDNTAGFVLVPIFFPLITWMCFAPHKNTKDDEIKEKLEKFLDQNIKQLK